MNKPIISKYAAKNWEFHEYFYEEQQCPSCHEYFQVDWQRLTYEGAYAIVYCPYCGKKHKFYV